MNIKATWTSIDVKQILADRDQAVKTGICIHCHEAALKKCYSEAGRREFLISGMCEECFDQLFKEQAE